MTAHAMSSDEREVWSGRMEARHPIAFPFVVFLASLLAAGVLLFLVLPALVPGALS